MGCGFECAPPPISVITLYHAPGIMISSHNQALDTRHQPEGIGLRAQRLSKGYIRVYAYLQVNMHHIECPAHCHG